MNAVLHENDFNEKNACYYRARKLPPAAMSTFAKKIIDWQKSAGRHHLPWQNTRDPYRIWLSEVMLQQTQVGAVMRYFEQFIARFPTIAALAAAPLDEVMPLWAGLGYYARARNLHNGAQQIMAEHAGVFPKKFDDIYALSGIGRSTAAAISAFAFGERRAILDGNVKRVIARHFCVEGDLKSKSVEDRLWLIAEANLPRTEIESYTQGMMDMGAIVCKRNKPSCLICPVKKTCIAFKEGRIAELPHKARRRETPHRQTRMLVFICEGEVMLEKRPPTGIWGGLWSLPELSVEADMLKVLHVRYGFASCTMREMPRENHGFTHFSLAIFPIEITLVKRPLRAMQPALVWVNLDDAMDAAIPAPVKRILKTVKSDHAIKR